MARGIHRLTTTDVTRANTKPGRKADGGGLYLETSQSGSKRWTLRYQIDGKRRDMGLGPTHTVSLSEARDAALACRKLIREGVDPIEKRKADKASKFAEQAKAMTFAEATSQFLSKHERTWKNPKHRQQWTNTLETYAFPIIGKLDVSAIDTALVRRILEPIWLTKPETASRLRGRIERILDWAKVAGHREGDNPAQWKGHLEQLLPSKSDVRAVKHHSALPYSEVGAFITRLREGSGVAPMALEFLILTGARTSEVTHATIDEFDIQRKIWTIPADRMKSKREHRVPLNARALEIVMLMMTFGGPYLFPGSGNQHTAKVAANHLSNGAFRAVLKRLDRLDLTAHGFRSTFRDWISEQTGYPNHIAEQALAHSIPNAVEAAYRRGDLFEKRCRLMKDWGEFCEKVEEGEQSNVVSLL